MQVSKPCSKYWCFRSAQARARVHESCELQATYSIEQAALVDRFMHGLESRERWRLGFAFPCLGGMGFA